MLKGVSGSCNSCKNPARTPPPGLREPTDTPPALLQAVHQSPAADGTEPHASVSVVGPRREQPYGALPELRLRVGSVVGGCDPVAMTGRTLRCLVVGFALASVVYVAYYLGAGKDERAALTGINPFIFGLPAALLAYAFQVRLTHVKRLDEWMRRVDAYAAALRNTSIQHRTNVASLDKDKNGREYILETWERVRANLAVDLERLKSLEREGFIAMRAKNTTKHNLLGQVRDAITHAVGANFDFATAVPLVDEILARLDQGDWQAFTQEIYR